MEFLTLKDLKLNAAGYLINASTNKPVTHDEFVNQQKTAEYVVKLADAIKDKNFTCVKIDNLEEIKRSVLNAINAKNTKEYVSAPIKPTSKVNDELVKLALDFIDYDATKTSVDQINKLMAQFDVIDAVASVGDYFDQGLVKLNAIYDIETILAAVKINAEKLK